jgi:hypothetical protein
MVLARSCVRSTTKIDLKNSLYPFRYFTEHLVDVFRKLLRENDLDHESSSLLIRWLKSTTGISLQQSPHTTSENRNHRVRQADALVKHHLPCPAEETRRAEQPHLRVTRTEGQINQHKWWNPEPVQDHRNQYRPHSAARRRTERTL